MPNSTHHQVLIGGGGTAGITVAAILKRRAPGANIAIVEPAHDHYYQPAFTLVGAGVYPLARTRRATDRGLVLLRQHNTRHLLVGIKMRRPNSARGGEDTRLCSRPLGGTLPPSGATLIAFGMGAMPIPLNG
jgi:2-polyprenyl-6-methoxyphenol hydroxylase-like FAD-dependent oxidoreductase